MQPNPNLQPGTILQIRPHAERYCGQFCVFVQARDAGAKCYVKVRDGVVYMTYSWAELEPTGGRAVWRPAGTVSAKARVPIGNQRVTPLAVALLAAEPEAEPARNPTPEPPPSPRAPAPARRWVSLDAAMAEIVERQAHG